LNDTLEHRCIELFVGGKNNNVADLWIMVSTRNDNEEFCLLGYNAVWSGKSQHNGLEEYIAYFFRVEEQGEAGDQHEAGSKKLVIGKENKRSVKLSHVTALTQPVFVSGPSWGS
jgi:hypothetical protein